jgi:hypothetical protein
MQVRLSKSKKIIIALVVAGSVLAGAGLLLPSGAEAETESGMGTKTIVVINKAENVLPSATGIRHNSPLYKTTGEVVGSDAGGCELLPPRGGIVNEFACDAVLTFSDGSVTVYGKQQIPTDFAESAVTGGTGAYKGCEGTITGVPYTATLNPLDVKITLKLTEC